MKLTLRSKNKGFSLIEVAIAIVVIGLIVGFTIKGKELVHTAKLNATVEQVNSFKIAMHMFVEKYGALPGDLSNAKKEISESINDGRGTGEISSIDDAKRFWEHLVAAGLIAVDLSATSFLPACKLGGHYSAYTTLL